MKLKKQDFYGELKYNGEMYPFYYDNFIVKIIQTPGKYNDKFNDATEIEKISGITNSGKTIVFLKCELRGGRFKECYSNLVFSTKGYVLFEGQEYEFDCIRFNAKALGTFYPSMTSVNQKELFDNFNYNLEHQKECFDVEIDNEIITMELKNEYQFSLRSEEERIGNKKSTWTMKFAESKKAEDIAMYYLYLYDFLSFVNFRRYIEMDNFVLFNSQNEFYNIAEGKFNNYKIPYDGKPQNSVIYSNIKKDIGRIFSYIGIQRKTHYEENRFMPLDLDEFTKFDQYDWLKTAIRFEGEYLKKYAGNKYSTDNNFVIAKDFLLQAIDQKIEQSGVSMNNPKNKYWKKFKRLISYEDTTLEEKFNFALDHFKNEIESIKDFQVKEKECLDKVDRLGAEYSEFRNKLAHGSFEQISPENCVNFTLMRSFIYCFILERAGASSETIKVVIEKLFLK